ncbi:MAG: AAA family ATPase, partial [Planctomycetia bacterium]|nr:AAA family ATPase [Planctomycetia bacterium]
GPRLSEIEPGRYKLIVLDAWYRFLPPGLSENDNAGVMSLYNLIDGYAERLGAAWLNVHHASKGDQGGKGITDVGSGAGSQSRAADTHLIIRPHENDGVAVVEAVVRSWPAVDKLAVRFDFPVWSLDRNADPNRLGSATARARREGRDSDQRELVKVAMDAGPAVKTKLRNLLGWGSDRFGRAFDPLEVNGTLEQSIGVGEKGQKRILWVVKQDE